MNFLGTLLSVVLAAVANMTSRVDDEEHFRGLLLQWKVPDSFARRLLVPASLPSARWLMPCQQMRTRSILWCNFLAVPQKRLQMHLISPDAAALCRVFKECLSLIPGRHDHPIGPIEACRLGPETSCPHRTSRPCGLRSVPSTRPSSCDPRSCLLLPSCLR